jgi:alpha-1,2-glucosyltransferase
MFYIWKRVFSRAVVRRLLAPVYSLAVSFVTRIYCHEKGVLWWTVFLLALALTLLPVHLTEPRYFTPGVIIALLNMPVVEKTWILKIMVSVFFILNVVTVYVFKYRSFEASDGSVSRFMY